METKTKHNIKRVICLFLGHSKISMIDGDDICLFCNWRHQPLGELQPAGEFITKSLAKETMEEAVKKAAKESYVKGILTSKKEILTKLRQMAMGDKISFEDYYSIEKLFNNL